MSFALSGEARAQLSDILFNIAQDEAAKNFKIEKQVVKDEWCTTEYDVFTIGRSDGVTLTQSLFSLRAVVE